MATHKYMDKARKDARNAVNGIKKDAAAVGSEVRTDLGKARADLEKGVNDLRARAKRRRSGK